MHSSQHRRRTLLLSSKFAFVLALLTLVSSAYAQDKSAEVAQKLAGFDAFMEKTLKDWNAPGIGVGIVFAAWIQATARQPESAGLTRPMLFLGFALTEALALLGIAFGFVFQ